MSPLSFSPQIFDNTCGVTADLFTLKYYSRANLHYHDCAEIGLCVEGSGVCFVQQQALPFVQGQVTFVRAGEAHIFQSPDQRPSRWFFFYVADEIFQDVSIPSSGVFRNHQAEQLLRILWDVITRPTPDTATVRHLTCALPGILYDGAPAETLPNNDRLMKKILPALEYISKHYNEKLTISKLAEQCYLSESFFRHCFNEAMNETPHTYINRVRLAFAKSLLLSTDNPILEISQISGFESISSFNRSFKTFNGISPREYRARNQLK